MDGGILPRVNQRNCALFSKGYQIENKRVIRLTGLPSAIFTYHMLKHLSLLLIGIAALLFAGCAENQVCRDDSYRAGYCHGSVARPVYYCGGLQYYSIGDRYCYFWDHQTHYISTLPPGGHYYCYNYGTEGTSGAYYQYDPNAAYYAPLHANSAPQVVIAPKSRYVAPVSRYAPSPDSSSDYRTRRDE